MTIRTRAARGLAALFVASVIAGIASQELTFEVAVLKRNVGTDSGQMVDQQGLRYRMVNVTLRTMILNAYRPRSLNLVGAPGWAGSDRYDLEATVPPGTGADQRAAMLRSLLAE